MAAVTVPDWAPAALRFGIAGLVAPPGIGKFLTYGTSVAFFTSLGIPAARTTVAIVGVVELSAVALLVLDEARWLAAASLVPVMLVALWAAGEWQAAAVLAAAVALLAVETDLVAVEDAAGAAAGTDADADDG